MATEVGPSELFTTVGRPARYKVTGKYAYTNKNFPAIHTDSLEYALQINLWRGHVWEMVDGKWKIIRTVWN